jgi:putative methyltransferase
VGEEEEDEAEAEEIAEACVRAEKGDGKGVMGFFVVCFVRDRVGGDGAVGEGGGTDWDEDGDGPYVRDAQGRIVRDENGIPTLKSTGRKVIEWDSMADEEESESVELRFGEDDDDEDGPFERDAEGRIVRGVDGMPRLKRARVSRDGDEEQEEEEDNEWGGFDD